MHIGYASTQQTTCISRIVQGIFSTRKKKEIALSRGSFVEIFFFEKKNGKISSFSVINFFSQIVFHTSFRFEKEYRDYLFILDRNGNMNITRFDQPNICILIDSIELRKTSHLKDFYNSNLAFDRKNLNFMICGIQTSKFISSIKKNQDLIPIFSNKSFEIKHRYVICFYIICIRPETTNASNFACIETFYDRPYEKVLVFYYVSFISKIVKRKVICQINYTSYMLIYVPDKCIEKEAIVIFSEGFFTIVNLLTLEISIKNMPLKKRKGNDDINRIVSFDFFIGKERTLYLLATQDGDLLKFIFTYKFKKNYFTLRSNIEYLDTIEGKISCIQILSGGFIFLSMETGNHLFFQFIGFNKNKYQINNFYFYSRYNHRNILLIEEFLQNLPVLSAEFNDFISLGKHQILLLCGTNSKSSIRMLNYTCLIKNVLSKKLTNNPLGINIIEIEKNIVHVLISFNLYTAIFFLGKKLGEINNSFFITDSPTIIGKYIESRRGVVQSTKQILRFINFFEKKNRISEWKLFGENFITDFSIFEKNIVHILIFISSQKGILLEILKNGTFIELEVINLYSSNFISLFGVSIKTNQQSKWDFLVILGKEEKSVRSFSIKKACFIKLVAIQLLPWYPVSAKFIFQNKEFFLLISLDDGKLIYTKFDKNTGQIKIIKIIKISIFPIYISKGNFIPGVLLFDLKIWIIEKDNSKNYPIKLIIEGPVDLVECSKNIILTTRKNRIKIWINKNNFSKISNLLILDIISTPIDLSILDVNKQKRLICFISSEINSKNDYHQMNLLKKNTNFLDSLFFYKTKENECTNILFISPFFHSSFKKKNFDFILYRGANSIKHWNSIYSNNIYKAVNIVMISSVYLTYINKNYNPLNRATENIGKISSLLCFYIKKKLKYNYSHGGRFHIENKICFIFEKFMFYDISSSINCFISKKLLGKRFVICHGNILLIIELKFNNIQKICQFKISSLYVLEIDILKNIILTVDSIEGFKVFSIKNKKKSVDLIGEYFDINNLSCGKILDPLTVIISDKIGNVYFFRQKDNSNYKKEINLLGKKKIHFILICQLILLSPVKRILNSNSIIFKKTSMIYLICIDGNIISLKPILTQQNILLLTKLFSKLNFFFNQFKKKKNNSNKKILFKAVFKSFNINLLFLFLK
nr:splicing factor 3b subunit 3 [Cryptomonas curvata]